MRTDQSAFVLIWFIMPFRCSCVCVLQVEAPQQHIQPPPPTGPTYVNVRPGDCVNVATLALSDSARLRPALGDYTALLLAHELDPPPDEGGGIKAEWGESPGAAQDAPGPTYVQSGPDATLPLPPIAAQSIPFSEQRKEQELMGYIRLSDENAQTTAPPQSFEPAGVILSAARDSHASKTGEAAASGIALWELQGLDSQRPKPDNRSTSPQFSAIDGASATASPTAAQTVPEEDELELWWVAQRLDEMDALVVSYTVEEGEAKDVADARDYILASLSDRCAHRALPLFVTRLHQVAQQKKREAVDGEAQEMRSYTTYEITPDVFRKLLNLPGSRDVLPVMDERLFFSDLLGLEKKAQKAIRLSLAAVLTRFHLSEPPFAEHSLDIAALAWSGPPLDCLLFANRATRQVHAVRLERGVRTRVATLFTSNAPWTPLGLLSLGLPPPAEEPLVGEPARATTTGGPEFLLLEGELHDGVATFRVILVEWREVPDAEATEQGAVRPVLDQLEICKMGTIYGYKWLPGATFLRLGSGYVLAATLWTESIHVYYVEPRQAGWTPRHGGRRLQYVTYLLLEGPFLGMDVMERAPVAERNAEKSGAPSQRKELEGDADLQHVHSHESVLVGVYRANALRLERALVSVRSAMDHFQPLVLVPLLAIPENIPFVVIPRDPLSEGLLLMLDPGPAFGAVTVYSFGYAAPKHKHHQENEPNAVLQNESELPQNGQQAATDNTNPETEAQAAASADQSQTPSASTSDPKANTRASDSGDRALESITDPSDRRARDQTDQLRATLEGRANFQRGEVRVGTWTAFSTGGHEGAGTAGGGAIETRLAVYDRSTKSLLIYRCVRRKNRI